MSVELLGKSLSDLSIVTMIFRIILSMACGGVIGLERGKANQPAGMRTYMLVSLGSCVVMITGEFLFYKYGAECATFALRYHFRLLWCQQSPG